MSRQLRFPLQRSASVDTLNLDVPGGGNVSNHSSTPTEYTNVIDRFRSQLKRAASFSALHQKNTLPVPKPELKETKDNTDCNDQEPKRGRIAFSSLLRVATEQALMKPKRRRRSQHVDATTDEDMPTPDLVESNVQPIQMSYDEVQEQRLQSRAREISQFLQEALDSRHSAKTTPGAVPQRVMTRRLSYDPEYSRREEERRQARTVAASLIRAQRLKKEFAEHDLKRSNHSTPRRKMTRRSSAVQKTKMSLHTASTQLTQHTSTTRLPRRRTEIA